MISCQSFRANLQTRTPEVLRLRQAEGSVARRFLVAPRRLAAAAAIVAAIGAGALVYESRQNVGRASSPSTRAESPRHIQLATKPVVETYQSQNATIVEMPSEGKNDAQLVMIFDESLPADL